MLAPDTARRFLPSVDRLESAVPVQDEEMPALVGGVVEQRGASDVDGGPQLGTAGEVEAIEGGTAGVATSDGDVDMIAGD